MIDAGPFKLGEWLIQPAKNSLERGGKAVRIEPRYMDLLVYLCEHQDQVVSADQIHANVWTGMVVGDHSVYQGIARLRKVLGDKPDHPRYIETVPKRGYRLLPPITPWTLDQQPATAEDSHQEIPSGTGGKRLPVNLGKWLLPAGLALLMLFVALWFWLRSTPPPVAGAPQILAVLPFELLDPDSSDDYLAYGLSAELLTQISKVDGLQVLGHISSARFKPGEQDLRKIGQQLGADLLVVGNVGREGGLIWVYIELIDSRSGGQLWSERIEAPVKDLLALETSMADQLIAALGKPHTPVRAAYWSNPSDATLDAYDYYLLGRFHKMNRNQRSLEKALEMYQRAVARDPNFAAGYRGIAAVTLLLTYYSDIPLARAIETAMPNLERAQRLNPNDEEIYGTLGLARYMLGEYGVAEDYLIRALALNANYANAWMWRGLAVQKQGKLREAAAHYQRAAALEPLSVVVITNLTSALSSEGKPAEALTRTAALGNQNEPSIQYHRMLSELSLQAGDLIGAYRHAQRAEELDPSDQLSVAQLALVSRDLEQFDKPLGRFEQSPISNLPGSGEQRILAQIYIRLDHDARQHIHDRVDKLFPLHNDSPEIVWRRRTALLGMSHTFLGNHQRAIDLLGSALRSGEYALFNTDFDLLFCTALAFSRQQTGNTPPGRQPASDCEAALNRATELGWNSPWTHYTSAQIASLRNQADDSIAILQDIYQRGFTAIELLQNDPLLAPIRDRPGYKAVVEAMQQRAAKAWAKLSSSNELPTP